MSIEERTFIAPGINCGNCTATIGRELRDLDGVTDVEADPATKRVTVRWAAPATWEGIHETLVEIGFPPAEAK
jgi:copper chaperone